MGLFAGTLLLIATVLGIVVTVWAPYVHFFDIARITSSNGIFMNGTTWMTVRWGVGGFCTELFNVTKLDCDHAGFSYDVTFSSSNGNYTTTVSNRFTSGLVVHPFTLAATFLGMVLSALPFPSFLICVLASIGASTALALDIILFEEVKHRSRSINDLTMLVGFGPGFWVSLTQCLLLLIVTLVIWNGGDFVDQGKFGRMILSFDGPVRLPEDEKLE